LIHHEGGSTFVTTGASALGFCEGSFWLARVVEQKAITATSVESFRITRQRIERWNKNAEVFTPEA
jgi:hypothetical protein